MAETHFKTRFQNKRGGRVLIPFHGTEPLIFLNPYEIWEMDVFDPEMTYARFSDVVFEANGSTTLIEREGWVEVELEFPAVIFLNLSPIIQNLIVENERLLLIQNIKRRRHVHPNSSWAPFQLVTVEEILKQVQSKYFPGVWENRKFTAVNYKEPRNREDLDRLYAEAKKSFLRIGEKPAWLPLIQNYEKDRDLKPGEIWSLPEIETEKS